MALLNEGDLEVEKLLIWKTKLPLEHKVRQSSNFLLMGCKWCLRFKYFVPSRSVYHMITLHQVIDGQVIDYPSRIPPDGLEKTFSVKIYLTHPTIHGIDEIGATNTKLDYQSNLIWHAGNKKDNIFKKLPCLYDRSEVKVVCKFFDHPQSTLQLKIGSDDSCKLEKNSRVSSEVPLDFQSLSSDFSDLFEKNILPDVKLECEGEIFQAHRSVLAARSAVFRAMFVNKMLESETGAVKIQDMNATVLQKLLRFVYSGKLQDLTEDCTADLYEAADRYDIVSLKAACSCWMTWNLGAGNCVRFLQIASSHSDTDLKAAVTSFIVENPSAMMSASWMSLSKELPPLTNEVFQNYVASTIGSHHN